MKVTGTIRPLRDNVFVSDMDFGEQRTKAGVIVVSDDGKSTGIHPRWGRVWAIGPDQQDVDVGDWILVEHGRWTRTVKYEDSTGQAVDLRMVENKAIMIKTDERPNDVVRMSAVGAGSNVNFNIPGA